ncbi:sirohydrochlorin chelatase [Bifidobacterium tissieri]|uniref:Transcriptional regulator n=1 Tax=Bifidobacterium tissieri TaxID=1630162 RepID=A0A5M9ZZU5_9BIFI|nr:CbiX/SirB N-terminal domain-containing protein [Bifidobacterium tissieri]KAA8826005.1 transcriptional regulator [Bifidobacterium tissieri]KAA8832402.1 transcriptional regulator [Bifidobacterium tissieri]
MTTGYLYVLHGRRGKIPESNLDLLNNFIQRSEQIGRISFLEGDEQTLEDGIRDLQSHVSHLTIVPVLLFSATHMRWDIPQRTRKVLKPGISLSVTEPLATTRAVRDYLVDHLGKAVSEYPGRRILLVAHGTPHFPEPFDQLQALASDVERQIGVPIICTNHIGHPLIEETLRVDPGPLIVERLFLTDGRLANKIKARVEALTSDAVFLPTLEDDPVITAAIQERLSELTLAPAN